MEVARWDPTLHQAVLDLSIDVPLFVLDSRQRVILELEFQLEQMRAPVVCACRIDPKLEDWWVGDKWTRGITVREVLKLQPFSRNVGVIVLL